MPVHDWTRVTPGMFYDFHHGWTGAIKNALNGGGLPPGYYALAEQVLGGPIPDVIALHAPQSPEPNGGIAMAQSPPKTRFKISAEIDIYAAKANRIAIHHPSGDVVAIVEIVSPGNKSSQHALRSFVRKACEALDQGIDLLVIDLFPPGPRDPQGIHKAIWNEISDEPFQLPPDKPLTLAAYVGGALKTAYVEPVGVGDLLPSMPIFLSLETYISAPLEATYETTWSHTARPTRPAATSRPRASSRRMTGHASISQCARASGSRWRSVGRNPAVILEINH